MTTRAGRPERSVDEAKVRRATIAAAIGNTVETYDYAVYGFLAAVLGKLFFPGATPGAALLSAFAVFGAAFLVRPIGGVILGPLANQMAGVPPSCSPSSGWPSRAH